MGKAKDEVKGERKEEEIESDPRLVICLDTVFTDDLMKFRGKEENEILRGASRVENRTEQNGEGREMAIQDQKGEGCKKDSGEVKGDRKKGGEGKCNPAALVDKNDAYERQGRGKPLAYPVDGGGREKRPGEKHAEGNCG